MDNAKPLTQPDLPFTAEVGAYSNVIGGSVHLIAPDGRFMGQIAYLCQDDVLRYKDLQIRMPKIIADALNRRALPFARAEVNVAVAARLPDGFMNLINVSVIEAHKAMRRWPQPNYVLTKFAEEAGEVVKAAIHYAEGRETREAVIAKCGRSSP